MRNLRKYGSSPFIVAVTHGGPGAPGGMASVAKELAKSFGVLEPLQTKGSIKAQVEELKQIIIKNGSTPITLVGWSWGAWLSYLLAARYPRLVKKLILVGSGPFEQKYVSQISKTRSSRLNEKEKNRLAHLSQVLKEASPKKRDAALSAIGELFHKTDDFDPYPNRSETIKAQFDIYEKVWGEAAELRQSSKLIGLAKKIKCPVVAIHGEYDPHPYKGVKVPLGAVIKNFKFILLKNCGHTPWLEKQAKKEFYKILSKELE